MGNVIVQQAVEYVSPGFSWTYCEWSDGTITRYSSETQPGGLEFVGEMENVKVPPINLKWVNTKPEEGAIKWKS